MDTITQHLICDRCNDVIVTDPGDDQRRRYGRYFTIGTRTDPADRSDLQVSRAIHLCPEHWVDFAEALSGERLDWEAARDRVAQIENPADSSPFDAIGRADRKAIINAFLKDGSLPEQHQYDWS